MPAVTVMKINNRAEILQPAL